MAIVHSPQTFLRERGKNKWCRFHSNGIANHTYLGAACTNAGQRTVLRASLK
jgi:hypothetical protein